MVRTVTSSFSASVAAVIGRETVRNIWMMSNRRSARRIAGGLLLTERCQYNAVTMTGQRFEGGTDGVDPCRHRASRVDFRHPVLWAGSNLRGQRDRPAQDPQRSPAGGWRHCLARQVLAASRQAHKDRRHGTL